MTKDIKDIPPEIRERVAFWEIKSLKKHSASLGTENAQKEFEKSLSEYMNGHIKATTSELPKAGDEKLMAIFHKLIPDYATRIEYDYFKAPPSPQLTIRIFLDGGNVNEWSKNATIVNLILEDELNKKFPGVYYSTSIDKEYEEQERKWFDGYPITIRHYFWRKETTNEKYVSISLLFSNPEMLYKPTPEEKQISKIESKLTYWTNTGEEYNYEIPNR